MEAKPGTKLNGSTITYIAIIIAFMTQASGLFFWGGTINNKVKTQEAINLITSESLKDVNYKLDDVARKEDIKELKFLIVNEQSQTNSRFLDLSSRIQDNLVYIRDFNSKKRQ